MYRLTVFLLCMLLGCSQLLASTTEKSSVAWLTQADGVVGESVNRVITDHNGLTWIATNSGVNTFNGKVLHPLPITGLHGRLVEVYDLCEAASSVYAATDEGLWRITLESGVFERILPEIEKPLCLYAADNRLYIGSQQGIHIFDGRQLKHVDVSVGRGGLDNIVRQYDQDEHGVIWFLGRKWLGSYDPAKGKVTHYQLPANETNLTLTRFACLEGQRFVIGTHGSGLFVCDLARQTFERVEQVGNVISSVQRSPDGLICVATNGAGAYLLDGSNGQLSVREFFSAESDICHRLPSNALYSYYRDANGVSWFGFVRYGLAYTYHRGNEFRPFKIEGFTTEGLNIRTFCRHAEHVLLGTQNGFYYVNTATQQFRKFTPADLGGAHIVNTIAWYDDRFYIGTFDGGLHVFNAHTMQLQKQQFSPLIDGVSIGDVKTGRDGRLWIGCNNGLFIIENGQVQQHFTEQNSPIIGGLILSITFDDAGNAWLTGATGCSVYSAKSREIVKTQFPDGFFHRLPWMKGAAGHNGLVFMRTGPQTFYTNGTMNDFGELKLPVRFTDKWCRSFVDDGKGYYLVASERGLYCFNYELTTAAHFGYGEGLVGDYINYMAGDDGDKLWVATSQGLYFTERKVWDAWVSNTRFKTQLIDIRCGSDLLIDKEVYAANTSHRLKLSWNIASEVLQAECMLMDYSKHHGRLYEYKVDGDSWKMVADGQTIYIKGLKLGQHVLEVRLAGAVGTTTAYTITVLPSAWAVIELLCLVVALILLWLWWRYRKNTKALLTERNEIEDALVESEELRVKSEESLNKYERVKIDEAECADIVRRMTSYLEKERVYTNQDLKMKDLAEVLHMSAPKLSQVFNIYLKENYYEFINRYRLEEFKRLIAEGEYKRYTITALSEQSGFKKSNFFSTFRKVEGMTPVEYLKKKGVKLD